MDSNTNNNNSLKIILAVLVVLAIGLVSIAGVNSLNKKNKTSQTNLVENTGSVRLPEKKDKTASLFYSPSSQSVKPGGMITAMAYMDTGISKVNGVEFKIIYDTDVFEVLGFTKESGLNSLAQEIRNKTDNDMGVLAFSSFGLNKDLFLNGAKVPLYTLKIKVKETATTGTYTINLDPSSVVSADGAGQDVFKGATPLTITVTK